MTTESQKYELLEELLLVRATSGLSKQQTGILKSLLAEFPDTDIEEYEVLLGKLDVALNEHTSEEIPQYLRNSIIDEGENIVFTPDLVSKETVVEISEKNRGRLREWRWNPNLLWGLALAASLQLAIIGWLPRNTSAPAVPEITVSQSRAELIENSPDTVIVAWAQTEDPLSATVSGDVVWSNQAQEGYMRFQGLPVNDPKVNQYQLWIFDEKRDKHPVDGGVFDATKGELIVPIREKLAVYSPTVFAVTLEKPGGVVVSDKEHIVALAKL